MTQVVEGFRNVEPKTVAILGNIWRVLVSPHPLDCGGECQLDHVDRIIWLSAGLGRERRVRVLTSALQRAAMEAIALVPSVE